MAGARFMDICVYHPLPFDDDYDDDDDEDDDMMI